MKSKTDECNMEADGDYLAWDPMDWDIRGATVRRSISKHDLCMKEAQAMIITAPFYTMHECVNMCSRLITNGSMMTVRTPQENQSNRDLLKFVLYGTNSTSRRPNMTSDSCWLPITDEAEEGQWLDIYTEK